MMTLTFPRKLVAGIALAVSTAGAFAATAPSPFTATYQVLQGGEAIGEATFSLKPVGNGVFEYSSQTKGTSGVAAMLGINTDETTRFRWGNGAPETESYEYRMQGAIKNKQRYLTVDRATHLVRVDEGKGVINYASVPGMVDRNTMPFALGLALRGGKQNVTLPVGVKQRVESQQFKVTGTESVKVPAGSFKAERVERSDAGSKNFSAWYVPQKYPLPVKLAQAEGGDLTLLLVSYKAN